MPQSCSTGGAVEMYTAVDGQGRAAGLMPDSVKAAAHKVLAKPEGE